MKFSVKTFTDKPPEVTLGGQKIDPNRLAGMEIKAGNGAIPHVVLTLIPSEMEVDLAKAAVTQVEADVEPAPGAAPPPDGRPPKLSRRERRAHERAAHKQ